jgi:DNA-binding MarR family transcriptional regulator
MDSHHNEQLIGALLGNANVFVSALSGIMERRLLIDIAGKRLTLSQLKVLKLLDVTGARNIGDVAAFLGVSDAAASKTADRLVRRKYLRRVRDLADRRSSELSLAPAGHKLLQRYEAARNRKLGEAFAGAGATELRQTAALLERLTKAIVTHSGNGEEVCLQCGIYFQKRCPMRDVKRAECTYQQRDTRRRNHNGAVSAVATGRRSGLGAAV